MRLAVPIVFCTALAVGSMTAASGAMADSPRTYQVSIDQPANDATVFSNPGDADVKVSVAPELSSGDHIVLWLDQAAMQPPGGDGEFHLTGVDPGKHILLARVVDAKRNVLASSPPVTFYMWHASKLYPNRREK